MKYKGSVAASRVGNPDDRPREKLGRLGPAGLGDNELLAIIIGSGPPGASALALADVVLAEAGGLRGLLQTACEDLIQIRGLGQARVAQVLAAVEIGRRAVARPPVNRPQIGCPRDAADLLMPEYGTRPTERFGVVLLDTRHRVLRTHVLAAGTLDRTSIEPRDVFRQAVVAGAAAVVLFHNHPSGDPSPSRDDLELTRRMMAAGVLMGVPVVDHVVLGDGRFCSVIESGLL